MAELLNDDGTQQCQVLCEHNGVCTLDLGHAGDHEAWGLGKLACTWPYTADENRDPITTDNVFTKLGELLDALEDMMDNTGEAR